MRSRKKIQVFIVLAAFAAGMVCFWFILRGTEKLFAGRDTAETKNTAQETAEADSGPEIQGEVELYGDTYTYDHEIESWLVIGTDGRGTGTPGVKGYRGDMADFLVLAVFDKTDDNYGFLQIDRDTITRISILTVEGKENAFADAQLCMAHKYGGNPERNCENTMKAVSDMLGGVKIDGYYSISIDHIPELNHAVGGVEVTVRDDFSKMDPSLKMGETILLSDSQAENYVRGRMEVADGSNANRMARQREYVQGLFDKMMARSAEDPAFMEQIYQDMEDYAVASLTGRDLSRLMKRVKEGENRGLFQMEGTSTMGKALSDGEDHAEFYPDQDSVVEIMTKLYHLEKKKS